MRYESSKRKRFESLFFILFIFSLLTLSCHKATVKPLSKHYKEEQIRKYSSYPKWFWQMPHSNNALFAVGYAQTYFYRESSDEEATMNGINSLAKSMSVRVKGERGFKDTQLGPEFAGEDFKEELEEGVLDSVKKNYKVIATETVGNITLVLLCIGEVPILSSEKGFNRDAPGWVSELPQRHGFAFAVGQSTPQFHEEETWQLAEYNARVGLALSFISQLRSLGKRLDKSLSTASAVKTDVVLRRIQVVERWFDPENRIPYVLVRMTLKVNTKTGTDYTKKIAQPQLHSNYKQTREEIIQNAFKKLEIINQYDFKETKIYGH
jgi:hypothetical protein